MTKKARDLDALRAPTPTAASLPVHLTRFIGRTNELNEIAPLLASTRLVTLTGAGGSGKTRLAREMASHVSDAFERIGWVDLAAISDATVVPQQISTALRLPDRFSESAIESLVTSIGDAPTLIVLDNCEHLIDACATAVERLLRHCPRLSVLATSREALGIPSETAWLVPALASDDAVQLFVERAQESLPSFSVAPSSVETVREICRRLDGIPLAIELAAARVRALSLDQIAARLDDVFRLLTMGSRTALPRHRTLRGTMDWSYALLDDREQRLFRRLAVFSGTFGLDAAETVCSGGPLDAEDILDEVAALVDKSLVVMEPGDAEARYRLLETVRQYGVDLLEQMGELTDLRARHADYFLNLAEEITPRLIGGEHEPGLVARVSPYYDNLRAASAWALEDPERAAHALRFAGGLFWYWYCMGFWLQSGQLREGRQYVDSALSLAAYTEADPILLARALLSSGLIAIAQGENERARDDLMTSLELARKHGDDVLCAYVLSKLGGTYVMLDDIPKAMELLDEAFELAHWIEPQMVQGFVMYWRGIAGLAGGNINRARAMFDRCQELGERLQHRTVFAHASAQRGRVMLIERRLDDASVLLNDAIRVHVEMGDVWGLTGDLDCMVGLAMARERAVEAVRLMGAVDVLRESVALALPAIERQARDQMIVTCKKRLGASFARAYEEGRALSMDEIVRLARDAGVPTLIGKPQADAPTTRSGIGTTSPPAIAVRVLALGPLQVFVNDVQIERTAWGSARSRELLLYLLMHPDGRTREQIGLAFWPDASTTQVRNNVHVTLHRLRKALGTPRAIIADSDRYRVDPAVVALFDVWQFDHEVTIARKQLARDGASAAGGLEAALALYRGDFLDGEQVGDWHIEHRDRLQRLFADSLVALGSRYAADGYDAEAANAYRRVLASDDLNEDAAIALLRVQTRLGERVQAIRYYQRFVERMRRELDAEPGGELVELYEALKEAP